MAAIVYHKKFDLIFFGIFLFILGTWFTYCAVHEYTYKDPAVEIVFAGFCLLGTSIYWADYIMNRRRYGSTI